MSRGASIAAWAFAGLVGSMLLYELLLYLVEPLPFVRTNWRGWLVAYGIPVEIALTVISSSILIVSVLLGLRGKLPGTKLDATSSKQFWECPACGYDMSAIKSDLCPECGESLSMMRNR